MSLLILARTVIWAALGELVTRFMAQRPDRALLLPSAPDADPAELLHHAGTAALWPVDRHGFARTPPPHRDEHH
ncbi:hypothetical protein ACFY91_34640 [Streptomyces albogriseolus]|uniref:hypothetical protein n=1 Tax=Streptomyces albogriseolus TaxID=1887 RepID=UPI0036EE45BB